MVNVASKLAPVDFTTEDFVVKVIYMGLIATYLMRRKVKIQVFMCSYEWSDDLQA